MVVRRAGDGLELTVTDTGPLAATLPDPEETVQLLPVAEDVFAARSEPEDPWTILVFYQVDGRDYIHSGGRATPRHD
jgi:hypothetical protein